MIFGREFVEGSKGRRNMSNSSFYKKVTSLLLFGVLSCTSYPKEAQMCTNTELKKEDTIECKGGFACKCSKLNLKEVPKYFPRFNASKLCLLDLSWNKLTTIHNQAFNDLKDLKWLLLNQNNISNIEPLAFKGLSRLLYLDLSCNHLDQTSRISTQVFKPLKNLKSLNLKNNFMTSYEGLDIRLQPLIKLKELNLSGCYNCTFGEGIEPLHNLESLSLSGPGYSDKPICNISTLFNGTFAHMPLLKKLFIAFCNICIVEPGALFPLRNIRCLDISYNKGLKFSGMRNVLIGLAHSPIRSLDVSAIQKKPNYRGTKLHIQDAEPIQYLTKLEVLSMKLNKIEVIDERIFDLIPNSTHTFILSANRLTYGHYVTKLKDMKHMIALDLSRQHLNYDPFIQNHHKRFHDSNPRTKVSERRMWTASSESRFLKINEKYMFSEGPVDSCGLYDDSKALIKKVFNEEFIHNLNSSTELPDISSCKTCIRSCPNDTECVCVPENLKYLNWRASFVYVHIYKLKICSPNSLTVLNMSFNLLEEWRGPVYGLENLRHLNLAENVCTYMSSKFFDYFDELETLNVSFNHLGRSLDPLQANAGKHFKNLQKLKLLDLTGSGIEALATDLFESMTDLQYLYMGRNFLTQWNTTLNTKCLRQLDVSNNKLESLPESFRNYLDDIAKLPPYENCNRLDRISVKMCGNPIQCNCDNRPFLRWLMHSPVVVHFYDTDECHLKDGSRLKLSDNEVIPEILDRLAMECVPFVWIGISVGIFVISIAVCFFVYRYRWRLRYFYFNSRRRHHHTGYSRLFERDAFISYAKTEVLFIKDQLIPNLEEEHGLRIWVADRDALAGASIAENLTHAIYSSKKSVLILSKRYFAESWCNYEMNMARIESIESQRKLIIVVLYEDFSAKEMPLEYLRLLKTVPCIEYPKHPQHHDTFWTSLAEAIQEI